MGSPLTLHFTMVLAFLLKFAHIALLNYIRMLYYCICYYLHLEQQIPSVYHLSGVLALYLPVQMPSSP